MDCSGLVFEFFSVASAMLIIPPQKLYLSFYLAISVHLLTVLYHMMIEQGKKYDGLGVKWVLWINLGQFLDLFLSFSQC